MRAGRKRAQPPPAPAPQRHIALYAVALLVLVAIPYSRVLSLDFVPVDDPIYVSANPHVLGGLTQAGITHAFTSFWAGYWIPLTWLSYMTEVQFFGTSPAVFHATNALLHAANTLLLFFWLFRVTGNAGRSAFAAALFGVHPLHVESVAWITERKDVLSTLFLLLSLRAYTSFARSRSVRTYWALCAWFLLGLLAKPMLVTLPALLLVCDVWPLGRLHSLRWQDIRPLIVEKIPLAGVTLAASTIVFIAQHQAGATVTNQVFPLDLRLANAARSAVIYLLQTVWPSDLTLNYPYPETIPFWQTAGSVALLVAVTVFAVRQMRTRPYLIGGWLWYLISLAPVIGIVQVGIQPYADRFTYVPLIGIFAMVSWGAADWIARMVRNPMAARRAMATAAVAVCAGCALVAREQIGVWENGLTLWSHGVDVTPPEHSAQPRFELGVELLQRGRNLEAMTLFRDALKLQPNFSGAHAAMGNALQNQGQIEEARASYETALRLDPDQPEAQNNLGSILATGGKITEALPHFQAAVRLKPDYESALVNLGVSLARLGRKDEAITALSNALRMNPSNAQARRALDLLR